MQNNNARKDIYSSKSTGHFSNNPRLPLPSIQAWQAARAPEISCTYVKYELSFPCYYCFSRDRFEFVRGVEFLTQLSFGLGCLCHARYVCVLDLFQDPHEINLILNPILSAKGCVGQAFVTDHIFCSWCAEYPSRAWTGAAWTDRDQYGVFEQTIVWVNLRLSENRSFHLHFLRKYLTRSTSLSVECFALAQVGKASLNNGLFNFYHYTS